MSKPDIRFDDGAVYERGMGVWSRIAGDAFLDWLAPAPGLRWLDVGCGSGAFTELLLHRCAPAEAWGVDPSQGQIDYAVQRPGAQAAHFQIGDAMALPFDAGRFDAAVMALVIFFVPDPARSVAEMARVVRSGGLVSTYAWDFDNGGFPFEPIQAELRAMGRNPVRPPSVGAERLETLQALWSGAGLRQIETRSFTVRRTFADFDTFWDVTTAMALRTMRGSLPDAEVATLRERVRHRLPPDAEGRISYESRANAIRGIVG